MKQCHNTSNLNTSNLYGHNLNKIDCGNRNGYNPAVGFCSNSIRTVNLKHFSGVQFTHNNKKAQKYLLGGFECLVKLHQAQLLPRVPIVLKDLYDADLLEEDVILAWAEKVTGMTIRVKGGN